MSRCIESHFGWLSDNRLAGKYFKQHTDLISIAKEHVDTNPDQANRNFYGLLLAYPPSYSPRKPNYFLAESQFQLVLESDPSNLLALGNLAHVKRLQGFESDAKKIESTIELNPTKSQLANKEWALAYFYVRLFMYPAAIAAYTRAIFHDSKNYHCRLYLAIIYNRQATLVSRGKSGREEMLRYAEQAKGLLGTVIEKLENEKGSAQLCSIAYANMGRAMGVLADSNDKQAIKEAELCEAERCFLKSIDLLPGENSFKSYAAFLRKYYPGNEDEEMYRRSIEYMPTSFACQHYAISLKQKREACSKQKKNTGKNRRRKKTASKREAAADVTVLNEKILDLFRQAIDLRPSNYSAHIAFLRELLFQKNYNVVIRHCASYHERFTNKVDYMIVWAKALFKIGEEEQSLFRLRVCLTLRMNGVHKSEAIALVTKIHKTQKPADLLECLKWRLFLVYDLQGAEDYLNKLLALDPNNLTIIFLQLRYGLLKENFKLIGDSLRLISDRRSELAEFVNADSLDRIFVINTLMLAVSRFCQFDFAKPVYEQEMRDPKRSLEVVDVLYLLTCLPEAPDLSTKAWVFIAFIYVRMALELPNLYLNPGHWYRVTALVHKLSSMETIFDDVFFVRSSLFRSIGLYDLAEQDLKIITTASPVIDAAMTDIQSGMRREAGSLYSSDPHDTLIKVRRSYFNYCTDILEDREPSNENFQEIIVRSRDFLDQLFFQFVKKVYPDRNIARAYFPNVPENRGPIDKALQRYLTIKSPSPDKPYLGLDDFLERFKYLYDYLFSIQAREGFAQSWLSKLYALRNLTHGRNLPKHIEINKVEINVAELAEMIFFHVQGVANEFFQATNDHPTKHLVVPDLADLHANRERYYQCVPTLLFEKFAPERGTETDSNDVSAALGLPQAQLGAES